MSNLNNILGIKKLNWKKIYFLASLIQILRQKQIITFLLIE
jgi:hypothetical protein